jgi:hypothetical protein
MVHLHIHQYMEEILTIPLPLTNSHILLFPLSHWGHPHRYPCRIRSLNLVRVHPQPLDITLVVVEVPLLPICHMDHIHRTFHIFHFLVLPSRFILHRDNHMSVNFVHPFPIQQVHTFEQLNTTNLTHKKKGKNQNNDNLGPGGNDPHNHPAGGHQYQDPQGGTNNNQPQQGKKKNLRTNFPCAICGEYGHYTHHCPQIPDLQ